MSRLLVLLPILLWVVWLGQGQMLYPPHAAPADLALLGPAAYLLGLAGAVMLFRLAALGLARRPAAGRLNRFARMTELLRIGLILWLAVGLWVFDYGRLVLFFAGPLLRVGVETPSVLLAVLPTYAAGTALWWAAWPVEAYRHQLAALSSYDRGQAVHAPPTARAYVLANLRMGLLFGLAPILAVLLTRDVLAGAYTGFVAPVGPGAELLLTLASVAGVMLAAPLFLVRMLRTTPLPPGELHDRLTALAARTNVRYRKILLWHTDEAICNAAVMGLLPQLRYVLMSDLLLASLSPQQVEAVFAHEAGHVRHRHMLWYVLFIVAIVFAAAGPGETLLRALDGLASSAGSPLVAGVLTDPTLLACVFVTGVLLGFGLLSRLFERQADLFAARAVGDAGGPNVQGPSAEGVLTVAGAGAFASALQRVAVVNNMLPVPVASGRPLWRGLHRIAQEFRHFFHGSIELRTNTLLAMSTDPAAVGRFDLLARGVMLTILFTCLASAAWTVVLTL
ncbi:MAG: M48 family metallopeptidase [Phycisphaerae bacterium]